MSDLQPKDKELLILLRDVEYLNIYLMLLNQETLLLEQILKPTTDLEIKQKTQILMINRLTQGKLKPFFLKRLEAEI